MLKSIFIGVLFIISLSQFLIGQVLESNKLYQRIIALPENTSHEKYILNLEALRTVSLSENNKGHYAFSLYGLSYSYYQIEDYENFESALEEFFVVASDTVGLGMDYYNTAINHYSVLHKLKGNYKKSIELGLSSISIEKKLGARKEELGIIYSNISEDYRLLGDFENSLSNAFKALEQYESLTDKKNEHIYDKVSSYRLIAYSLMDLNRYHEALNWIRKGLQALNQINGELNKEHNQLLIDLLLRKVEINLQLNKLDGVVEDLNRVASMQIKFHYRVYYRLELLGEYFAKLGQWNKSIIEFDEALSEARKQYSNNRIYPAIPRILTRRAAVYNKMDSTNLSFLDLQNGLQFFQSNLSTNYTENPIIEISSSAIIGLDILIAKANYASSKFNKSFDHTYVEVANNSFASAMELIDRMRMSYINEGSKFYLTEQAQEVYIDYIRHLISVKSFMQEDVWKEELYNTIQRNKNSVLVERIKNKIALLSSNLPNQLLLSLIHI